MATPWDRNAHNFDLRPEEGKINLP